jgi:hypothetical protein
VAVGKIQRLYSGVGIFNWCYVLSQFASSDPTWFAGPPWKTGADIAYYATAIPQLIKVPVRVHYNSYVTAVAVGQSQPIYSGEGVFNWYYPSSTPREFRMGGVQLE